MMPPTFALIALLLPCVAAMDTTAACEAGDGHCPAQGSAMLQKKSMTIGKKSLSADDDDDSQKGSESMPEEKSLDDLKKGSESMLEKLEKLKESVFDGDSKKGSESVLGKKSLSADHDSKKGSGYALAGLGKSCDEAGLLPVEKGDCEAACKAAGGEVMVTSFKTKMTKKDFIGCFLVLSGDHKGNCRFNKQGDAEVTDEMRKLKSAVCKEAVKPGADCGGLPPAEYEECMVKKNMEAELGGLSLAQAK